METREAMNNYRRPIHPPQNDQAGGCGCVLGFLLVVGSVIVFLAACVTILNQIFQP